MTATVGSTSGALPVPLSANVEAKLREIDPYTTPAKLYNRFVETQQLTGTSEDDALTLTTIGNGFRSPSDEAGDLQKIVGATNLASHDAVSLLKTAYWSNPANPPGLGFHGNDAWARADVESTIADFKSVQVSTGLDARAATDFLEKAYDNRVPVDRAIALRTDPTIKLNLGNPGKRTTGIETLIGGGGAMAGAIGLLTLAAHRPVGSALGKAFFGSGILLGVAACVAAGVGTDLLMSSRPEDHLKVKQFFQDKPA